MILSIRKFRKGAIGRQMADLNLSVLTYSSRNIFKLTKIISIVDFCPLTLTKFNSNSTRNSLIFSDSTVVLHSTCMPEAVKYCINSYRNTSTKL